MIRRVISTQATHGTDLNSSRRHHPTFSFALQLLEQGHGKPRRARMVVAGLEPPPFKRKERVVQGNCGDDGVNV